ncbi:sigma-70 family RNA polymerase sigma factor, partial [Omnitrophica bacterium]|nr:sigma-70 family RNA polymerase sigma factor [Candidatus Omnitrophota bacterium]
VDGWELAEDICDRVARDHQLYLGGDMSCDWPRIYLTYPQELALVKALREDPFNEDVKNAIVHCYALMAKSAIRRAIILCGSLFDRTGMTEDDVRQEVMLVLMSCLRNFEPEKGGRFITLFGNAVRPYQIRNIILERYRLRSRLAQKTRQFGEDDDDDKDPEVDLFSQDREPNPLENMFAKRKTTEIMRVMSVLSEKERLFIKLHYGIRFEGDPAVSWTANDIGHLCGTTPQAVQQVINRACGKMKGVLREMGEPAPLTDGDIYLAVELGMSPNSRFFSLFSRRDKAWLEENRHLLRHVILDQSPAESHSTADAAKGVAFKGYHDFKIKIYSTADAAEWVTFRRELSLSAELQKGLRRQQLKKDPLKEREREKYGRFKRLVAEYIYGTFHDEREREDSLGAIVALGTVQAPVAEVAKTKRAKEGKKKEGKERRLYLSEARRGKRWQAHNAEFGNVVYVKPRVVRGRLNIEVRNENFSQVGGALYDSYWDRKKGRPVSVPAEFADFFLDESNGISCPRRQMNRRAVVASSGFEAELAVFKTKGVKASLFIDPAYAYLGHEGNVRRLFWFTAFRDGERKGIRVHLTPDGPPVARTYWKNGEFVPERGPLLRSKRHSILGSDKGHGLIERLRILENTKEDAVVVRRRAWKSDYTAYNDARKTRYLISPFGYTGSSSNGVAVPGPGDYYIKFIPQDRAFEIYPTEGCLLSERVIRKNYDLNTRRTFDSKQELKRRFARFMLGARPNPIAVEARYSGRIDLADDAWINMGASNRKKPFFVSFTVDEATGRRLVSLYGMDETFEKGGTPVEFSRCVQVVGNEQSYSIEDIPDFQPYRLTVPERILVQERAYKLGYARYVRPIADDEEGLIMAA